MESRILTIRGQRVLLDEDLAETYGTSTKALNQAVRRGSERFPEDFAFQLTRGEFKALRSQIVTSKPGRGGRRYPPWAFTEHGSIMAAAVLNSPRAVETSVFVVRAFVGLREVARRHGALAAALVAIERKVARHDQELRAVLDALRALVARPERAGRRIGFASAKR